MTIIDSDENKRLSFRCMYFPLSKSQKTRHLGRVSSVVREYKQKIQDKTNIDLGAVEVKPYTAFPKDALEEVKRIMLNSGKVDKSQISLLSKIARPLLEIIRMYREDWLDLATIGSQGKIYVPFGFTSKAKMYWESHGKSLHLEQKVVHELSHILWDKLKGSEDSSDSLQDEKVWNEGFATYCDEHYFRDLFPSGYEFMNGDRPTIYRNGRKKVEAIIRERGDEALFQIPRRWAEFERDISVMVR